LNFFLFFPESKGKHSDLSHLIIGNQRIWQYASYTPFWQILVVMVVLARNKKSQPHCKFAYKRCFFYFRKLTWSTKCWWYTRPTIEHFKTKYFIAAFQSHLTSFLFDTKTRIMKNQDMKNILTPGIFYVFTLRELKVHSQAKAFWHGSQRNSLGNDEFKWKLNFIVLPNEFRAEYLPTLLSVPPFSRIFDKERGVFNNRRMTVHLIIEFPT